MGIYESPMEWQKVPRAVDFDGRNLMGFDQVIEARFGAWELVARGEALETEFGGEVGAPFGGGQSLPGEREVS